VERGKTKFIFVTGGVVSSLGKGLAAASLGTLLESRGLKVTLLKMDPYINVDPGTMSPLQHGEVFVTMTVPKQILTLATTSVSYGPPPVGATTAPPAKSTIRSLKRSGAATTSAPRCR